LKDKGENAPPREKREIEALQTLSKLTRGFECEGYELEEESPGKWVKKKGRSGEPTPYKVPNKTIRNVVKVGDKPYGY
jgi:hypothetical protein